MSDIDHVLYGHNPLERVVAVEPDGDSMTAILFQRTSTGGAEEHVVPFIPWLLTTEDRSFPGSEILMLAGDGFNRKVKFRKSGWRGFLDARRQLRENNEQIMTYGSQSRQFLTETGITLFKGMIFSDLRRMQIDIETSTLSPHDSNARILVIAMSDSSGRIEILDGDETELLEELGDRIRRWDPDVIEGHNIYGFDLPYILQRCKSLGVLFAVGRHPDRLPTIGAPRNCAIGAMSRPFTPVYIYGRHVIDTYLQVQRFDAPRGQISSYGLKECARTYNLSADNRIVVDRSQMQERLQSDPELIRTYARQDVEETRALAALVSPTDFYQTQMAPDVYQSIAVTGSGEKVNALMVREYLRSEQAIPFSNSSSGYPGGYTEVRRVGVIRPVVKTDVESLYPSLMLTRQIRPSSDSLNVFLPLLSELTSRRLDAKAQSKKANEGTTEHAYWDGLQNSFKVLINSFYGYIGGPFYFNDYRAAKSVTSGGQEIVKNVADELERTGSIVIEIDTDGIYFKPPLDVATLDAEVHYIDRVSEVVPTGIRLAHDGRYSAMLSLKIKNYVLVDYDGKKIMKGSSLRSRADELFGRKFLGLAVDFLLEEAYDQLAEMYSDLLEKILDGKLTVEEIVRRERVTVNMRDTPQRRDIAALISSGAITVGDIIRVYNRTDGSVVLEANYDHDEDRSHYADRLYKFASRLVDAIGDERFGEIFPKPRSSAQRLQDRLQSSFDF